MPQVVKRPNWVAQFFSVLLFSAGISGILTGIVRLIIWDLVWWGYAMLFGISFVLFSMVMLFYWFQSLAGYYESIDLGLIVEETAVAPVESQQTGG